MTVETQALLSYDRTVERSLVHRAAVSEVFLTGLHPVHESRFLAAAQLPLTHGYYCDHEQRASSFDPLLILEAGRQAGIGGASLLGLPPDIVMLVDNFCLRLTEPVDLAVGRRPGRLHINNGFEAVRVKAGRIRKGLVRQELSLNGVPIGTHVMECQILRPTELMALRRILRGSPAPSTLDYPEGPVSGQAGTHEVGRTDPRNVVLAEVVKEPGKVSARVAPRFDNYALFDHAYDHLPAMTLTEAARQLSIVALDSEAGITPGAARLTVLSGTFGRFAELDVPLYASAVPHRSGGSAFTVEVSFDQAGTVIASSELTLTTGARNA